MSFLEHPTRYLRFSRTSRDTINDACAVEHFAPRTRRFDGHRWIVPACLLAGLVVIVILFLEHM
jgi:hypothetical protein